MTLNELREALADDDEEVRYRALRVFGSSLETVGTAACDLLIESLGDSAWRVRKIAGQQLVALDDSQVFAKLIMVLADGDDAAARNAAAEALVLAGSGALPPLLAALGMPDEGDADQKKFIIDTLGQIGSTEATQVLVEALASNDPNLRASAAEALGKVGGKHAAEALTRHLEGDDLLLTLSALESLVKMRVPVPFSALGPLMARRLLRRPVLRLLSRCEAAGALEAIVEGFADPSRGSREVAVIAFGEWRRRHDPLRERVERVMAEAPRPVIEVAVIDALGSEEMTGRRGALEVLAVVPLPEFVPRVLAAAADERLEEVAEGALLRMGPVIAPELLEFAAELPPAARRVAFGVLARLGDSRAVAPLVAALDGGDDLLRAEATRALGELGDARAVTPLSRLLGRPHRDLARSVVEALTRLAEGEREAVLEACRERLGSDDPLRIRDVCLLLGQVGSLAELPLLEVALPHPDAQVRQAAVRALGKLAGGEALDSLRRALSDEAAEVRSAAVASLVEDVGVGALPALRVAVGDDNARVAARAIEGLGHLGDRESAELLLIRVGDDDALSAPAVAIAALGALDRLEAPQLAEALARGVAHPEAEVVKEAVNISARAPIAGATELLLIAARHEAWDVRRAAAVGLAERADEAALGPVQDLLAEETDEMVAAALESALRLLEARSE